MEEINLQQLLEAGCHFGHKSERWHPKAAQFIYTEKDNIHIIDLAKTKAGLEAAAAFVSDIVSKGGKVLFVATKRQAKGVVKEEADAVGTPYLVERWIGGFLTNWDAVKKNIEKINRLTDEQATGAWKKYPKHEQSKLARYLGRLKIFYGGVLTLNDLPTALFIVDVKKENAAVREGIRRGIPIVGIVDTNSNPEGIDYVIPANDDAVGSIQYITHVIARAYKEGKQKREKEERKEEKKEEAKKAETITAEVPKKEVAKQAAVNEAPAAIAKKKGRPKKTVENTTTK